MYTDWLGFLTAVTHDPMQPRIWWIGRIDNILV